MSAKQTTSGKKVVKKDSTKEVKQTAPVASTPVVTASVASTPVAVASSSSTVASTKKAGGKKAAVPVAEVKKVEVESEAKKVEAEPETKKVVESGGKKSVVSKSKRVVSSKKVVKKALVGKKVAAKKAAPVKKASTQAKKAASKKAVVKKEIKPEGDEEENSRTRFFKVVVDGGDPHGRFSGNKPKQAANKALTSILKTREQNGGGASGEIKFSIIECTRGSKHKQYNYIGQRVKLDKPMKVKIGSGADAKEIEYKFNNRVMKDKAIIAQTA